MIRTLLQIALVAIVNGAPFAYSQAALDETAVSQTLYASPTGASGNDGLSANSPKNLNGAISSAANVASKIILLDGDYRQRVTLPSGKTLLVIEAQNLVQAAVTGSDLAANWTDAGSGLYTLPWNQDWGLINPGFSGNWSSYNRRSEMLFINGFNMLQKCDTTGNAVTSESLNPGEFTVNESENLISFRPPTGVPLTQSTHVELTTRGNSDNLFQTSGRSNLVLRGIVFRHHGGAINQKVAVRIEGESGEAPANQIRIEDCAFSQNNGAGIELHNIANFSLTRVSCSDNGSRGGGGIGLRHGRITESSFNSNNWRTAIVNTGHDAAGFKLFDGQLGEFTKHTISDLTFLRCTFRDNNCVGFWQDYGGKNVTLDACLFENNEQGGIMQEMTPGPLTIKNCIVRNNGVWGIQAYGSPNVTITDNTIYDTRPGPAYQKDPQYCALINVVLDDRKSTGLVGTDPASPTSPYGHFKGWIIKGNTLQAIDKGGAPIFYATDYGSAANPNYPAKASLLTDLVSNNNHWWRAAGNGNYPATAAFFDSKIYDAGWQNAFTSLDFAAWQQARKQDAASTWGPIELTNVLDPTLVTSPRVVAQKFTRQVGSMIRYQIRASQKPTGYQLATGSLPTGLRLDPKTGIVSGVATATGNFSPTFTATNSLGTSLAVPISIEITAMPTSYACEEFTGVTVNNGGSGWADPWSPGLTLSETNLSYGKLQTTGSAAKVNYYGDGQATRTIATPMDGTVWISWLQEVSLDAAQTQVDQLRFLRGSEISFVVGQHFDTEGVFKIYTDGDGSIGSTSTQTVQGVNFITAAVQQSTGEVKIYVNPTGLGAGKAPSCEPCMTWNSGHPIHFDKLQTVGDGTNGFVIDEIRIGPSWSSVSPERAKNASK